MKKYSASVSYKQHHNTGKAHQYSRVRLDGFIRFRELTHNPAPTHPTCVKTTKKSTQTDRFGLDGLGGLDRVLLTLRL